MALSPNPWYNKNMDTNKDITGIGEYEAGVTRASDSRALMWQGAAVLAIGMGGLGVAYGGWAILIALVACFGAIMICIGAES